MMILSNAVLVDKDFRLQHLDLRITGKTISAIGEGLEGEDRLDLTGCYILPGFIDTHIHGANGVRISDASPDLNQITRFEATQGVTSIAITTASSAFDDLLRQIKTVANDADKCEGTKIAGIHAEGPFLNKKFKGAMNGENIILPNVQKLDQMIDASEGYLKLITIAPEMENAAQLIRHAAERGLTVSIGHSYASYQEAETAIQNGASQATHTFNAMRPYNHREPGILGSVLSNEKVVCEMICDYVHLHPATVQLIYRMKGADRINMVSDSGHAAGANIKSFMVDGIMRYVKDGVIRLEDGTIAGSAKTLLDGVKNLVNSGIPITAVAKMASYNPARTLKLDDKTGSIEVGKYADIVVLDQKLDVVCTFVNGECVYMRSDTPC